MASSKELDASKPGDTVIPSIDEKSENPVDFKESRRQPLWHVAVLYILTMSGYSVIWFFKNWAVLRDAQESLCDETIVHERLVPVKAGDVELSKFAKINPWLRSLGLLLPLVQLFLVWQTFKNIALMSPDKGAIQRQQPALAALVLVLVFVGLFWLYKLPGSYWLFFLTSFIPLAIAQRWLNQFWESVEEKNAPVRYAFSVWELLMLIIGSMFLGLNVVRPFVIQPQ